MVYIFPKSDTRWILAWTKLSSSPSLTSVIYRGRHCALPVMASTTASFDPTHVQGDIL